ncbi:MAG: N-acetyl-D-Glu racemase DgcA [Pseudomonadota bacterium]
MAAKAANGRSAASQRSLTVHSEYWPIAGKFTIARGSKDQAAVVIAKICDGTWTGRGECVPYARYGESVEGVIATLEGLGPALAEGLDRKQLSQLLPAGAARNALDCALWDLEAKQAGQSAALSAGLPALQPVETAYTISLGPADTMAEQARSASAHPLLKLKLGGDGDAARMRAVRHAVPGARLVVDANEAWSPEQAQGLLSVAAETGVELVEQPLAAGEDAYLAELNRNVPVCADESVHDSASLKALTGLYDAVNIKLDKTGGLTEALHMMAEARARGLKTMVGSMVATSLAMAPALLIAQQADWVDLDGPLLLARDRENGLRYENGTVHPPSPELWG